MILIYNPIDHLESFVQQNKAVFSILISKCRFQGTITCRPFYSFQRRNNLIAKFPKCLFAKQAS